MNGLRNVNKNGDGLRRNRNARRVGLAAIARNLKVRDGLTAGVFSALCLFGGVGFAQNGSDFATSSIPIAQSPWTSPSGRVVVDLNAKKTAAPSPARGIRQARALAPAPVPAIAPTAGDDLSVPSSYDDPLLSPESYAPSDASELLDPATLPSSSSDSFLDDGALISTPDAISEPSVERLEEVPVVAPEAPSALAAPNAAAPSARPTPRYDAPATIPGSSSLGLKGNADVAPALNANPLSSQNVANYGRNFAPRVSTNPYSRLGQAEYNPNQFYGGGNAVANGYRTAPPAAAFGRGAWSAAANGGWGADCGEYCGDEYCGYDGFCGDGSFAPLQNFSLEAGFLGMRSPLDFEDSGNFGGDFAANWASARPAFLGLSAQSGVRVTQSDLNGTKANGFRTDDARTQLFWTAGVFFRAPIYSNGWSAGVVYDYLKEDYYRKYELSQLRAELSRSFGFLGEIGFRGAFALNEKEFSFLKLDSELTLDAKASATSYYTLFLRKRFDQGAEATLFGGVTEFKQGLVGASFEAPLSESFAVKGGATYVVPKDRGLNDLALEENWNVSCGLVWRLGGNARDASNAGRPLFDVADNGSFLQNFLR